AASREALQSLPHPRPVPARRWRDRRRCRPTAGPWARRGRPGRPWPAPLPSCGCPPVRPPCSSALSASGNCLEIFREFGTKVCLTAFISLPDRGPCTFGTRPGGAFQRLCPRDDAPHLVHFAVAVKDDIDARCKDGRGLCREIPRKRLHGGIVADQQA